VIRLVHFLFVSFAVSVFDGATFNTRVLKVHAGGDFVIGPLSTFISANFRPCCGCSGLSDLPSV
jgi:hypothetical protein